MNFPDWQSLTPEVALRELPRHLREAEEKVASLEGANPTTFESFVPVLNEATRPVFRLWGAIGHVLSVMNSDAWREAEETLRPSVVAFSLRVGQSMRLYEIAKGVLSSDASLTPTRRRILEKMIQSATLSGVALAGEKRARFNEIAQSLSRLATDFSNDVLDATKAFSYEKGGVTYTIDDAAYPETMKHCADREVREKLLRARVSRAPGNAARIDEILSLRGEMAALLGFPDYATLSLSQKCAPSVEAVFKMIDELDAATAVQAIHEDQALGENVMPWDVAYLAERLREREYAYREEDLKKFFELEDVLKGLFKMAHVLFDIEVRECVGSEKPSVWHEDVRFFEVREKGEAIANFYFDPFVRNGLKSGGAWMNELRNRRVEKGVLVERPLAVVCTNFPQRDSEGKCLLPFREVETLFHEFGHALQQMLTRVDDEDAAGINLVEWDAVEVASQFMENWCLDDRTGIRVPADLKEKVRAAKNFRSASLCRRQLAFAKVDLVLHGADFAALIRRGEDDPQKLKTRVFRHFNMPLVEEDAFLNAFTHLFAGGYGAGYYGYKWSEVMSADCYGAFEEAGLADDKAVRTTGASYRETILALGGSRSALEVFRLFRGRDPKIDALLRQTGLAGSDTGEGSAA